MPIQVPKYRRHPTGQAFIQHVSIPTKDHRQYLGKYDSPESLARYQQFVGEILAGKRKTPVPVAPDHSAGPAVNEIVRDYLDYAEIRKGRGEAVSRFQEPQPPLAAGASQPTSIQESRVPQRLSLPLGVHHDRVSEYRMRPWA